MTRSRLTVAAAAAVTVDGLATAVEGRATAELGPRHGAELRLRIKLWLPSKLAFITTGFMQRLIN